MLKWLNDKSIKKWNKWHHIALDINYWVTINDEYLWIIYDTTDNEKLYSHIEDKISPMWIDLKVRKKVLVFNDLKIELEYFSWNHGGLGSLKIPISRTKYLPCE